MRVLISTQGMCRVQRIDLSWISLCLTEPTVVPPVLLDLCSVTILHRFTSPAWWQHLTQHVSADFSNSDAFDKVVRLQTGHALILAPSGLGVFTEESASTESWETNTVKTVGHIGRRYIIMKTRRRITTDGGASILAVADGT